MIKKTLFHAAEKLSLLWLPVWWDRHRDQQGYSEVQAWDTFDGILEIFGADDECLKSGCLPIEKPFVFISAQF